MFALPAAVRICVAAEAVDLRRGFDGLAAATRSVIGADPLSGHVFVFLNRRSLRWQRLKPFEKFAALIERHWEGITAYCQPENKVALGFVEGLNNKIGVMQRRCYACATRTISTSRF